MKSLYLWQSDEFIEESGLWNKFNGNNLHVDNYEYNSGSLHLIYSENNGQFFGARQELLFQPTTSHLRHEPIFGFWEARILVDPIRRGRACYFYLIPEAYNLNPDNSTTDNTARKGARIDILNQSTWSNDKYNVGIQWGGLEDGLQTTFKGFIFYIYYY